MGRVSGKNKRQAERERKNMRRSRKKIVWRKSFFSKVIWHLLEAVKKPRQILRGRKEEKWKKEREKEPGSSGEIWLEYSRSPRREQSGQRMCRAVLASQYGGHRSDFGFLSD